MKVGIQGLRGFVCSMIYGKMSASDKNNLYIRIAEFCTNYPAGFTQDELKNSLLLNEWETRVVDENFRNALMNGQYAGQQIGMPTSLDTMFFVVERGENAKFIMKYEAYFNYVDYLEFQEALRSSRTAMRLSWVAIILSSVLAIISIFVQLKST